ncbi:MULTISPECIES: type III secretion system export apparatus subunit SctU [Pseudomonas syringae group]|uniref:Type III secretion protein HrcU n=4 Tax=Pseudomonas syringae group TaxID=136849 RepID=A0AA40TTP0_9PSED|nr:MULTISPECIES: type III secretion system export apparatus subunit SctU [Pseudomonas syringae group]KGS14951.1 type III secretion system protein [Pseudomonas coronafaciens]KOP54584.1 type III secretion system protein [Pseudomonas coronafaciens pv. porri]KOP54757.1 type III secretion system protein [Pseudomonas coronafaciens pv. porri]KPB52904.1 Type III secretion protein HrcU [Pseudomonas coronafaciens pv. oryzae]KPW35394.1 Type III secretion protein HrcU [Pseudomonas coronafaciens pv. atropu
MSEKTQKATPKQLRDAREKGQVGQSQDIGKLLVLLAVSEVTLSLADESVNRLQALLALSFKGIDRPFMSSVELIANEGFSVLLSFTLCSVGLAMLMRLISSWMQIGFLFAPKALKIDINKINPFSHAKQMFSGQNITNLLMSILKASAIAAVLYTQVKPELGSLVLLANSDLQTYWHALLELFRHILRVILGLLLVIAMADFAMQKYFHAKKLRMSHEDIKKEYKQSEGDPHVKGHRRQLSHEILNQEPSAAPKPVEDADMLLVNPTHYAVALYYRPGETPLPMIHCKGEDDEALALIERAKKAGIPVVQNIWLARTLYKVKPGKYIPRPTLLIVAHIYKVVRQLDEITGEVIRIDDQQ